MKVLDAVGCANRCHWPLLVVVSARRAQQRGAHWSTLWGSELGPTSGSPVGAEMARHSSCCRVFSSAAAFCLLHRSNTNTRPSQCRSVPAKPWATRQRTTVAIRPAPASSRASPLAEAGNSHSARLRGCKYSDWGALRWPRMTRDGIGWLRLLSRPQNPDFRHFGGSS